MKSCLYVLNGRWLKVVSRVVHVSWINRCVFFLCETELQLKYNVDLTVTQPLLKMMFIHKSFALPTALCRKSNATWIMFTGEVLVQCKVVWSYNPTEKFWRGRRAGWHRVQCSLGQFFNIKPRSQPFSKFNQVLWLPTLVMYLPLPQYFQNFNQVLQLA